MEHKCKKVDSKPIEKCELNRDDIIKALECCAYGLCRDCALYSDDGCGDKVIIGAIELITSQEQRIKELTEALEDTLAINQRYIVERVKNAQPWLKKVNELTQANEMLSESYDHLEKTKDELLAERARLTDEYEKLSQSLANVSQSLANVSQSLTNFEAENERLRGILLQFTDIVHKWGNKNGYDTSEISLVPILNEETAIKSQIRADTVRKMQERIKERCIKGGIYPAFVASTIDQIAKEMLEGENES